MDEATSRRHSESLWQALESNPRSRPAVPEREQAAVADRSGVAKHLDGAGSPGHQQLRPERKALAVQGLSLRSLRNGLGFAILSAAQPETRTAC